MNIKKLVSAVSALAVAGSVFTGLALTSYAADSVFDKTYNTMTVEDGNTEAGNFTIVNPSGDAGGKSVSFVENEGIKYQHSTRTASSYAKASVGNASGELTITATWNTGNSYAATGNYTYISLNDDSDNAAFTILSQYNDKKLYLRVGNDENITMLSDVRNTVNEAKDISFTATYDTVYQRLKALTVTTGGGTYTLPNAMASTAGTITNVRIGALMGGEDPKGRKDMYSTLKALKIESDPVSVPAGGLTVQYKENGDVVGSTSIDVSANDAGAPFTYAYPAYVEFGDKLYTTEETGSDDHGKFYEKSVTLGVDAVTSDINVTAVDTDAYQLEEIDNSPQAVAGRDKYFSNGKVHGIGNSLAELLTVSTAGKYTVLIVTGTTGEGHYQDKMTAYANDTQLGEIISYNYPGVGRYENINLNAGDVIKLQGCCSKSAVDYVVIIKTGEYEPPVVTPEPVSAEKEQDFTTNGDNASVWKATVSGISEDASYTKIVAKAVSTLQGEGTGEVAFPTTATGKGSVLVYVVVPTNDATSVTVTLE